MKLESVDKLGKEKKRGMPSLWLGLLVVLAVVVLAGMKLYEMELPQIAVTTDIAHLGASKRVGVTISDAKSGVRRFTVALEQGGHRVTVYEKRYDGTGFVIVAGPEQVAEEFDVDAKAHKFTDGEARLVVTAHDYSWWHWRTGNIVAASFPAAIDTRPPSVQITASPNYIKAGGSGAVVYHLSEPAARHGVVIDGDFHPGYPLPAHGEGVYGATIAIRFDAEKIVQAYVTATDLAGNVGRGDFGMLLRRSPKKVDRINISDDFLASKLPEFAAHTEQLVGTPLEQYITINTRIRQENNKRIAEVCATSAPERFWQGGFGRLAGSNRAGYADYRTYFYNNEEIDNQVHLGIDLASTKHAEVGAANRGRVVFADYLGIYGNTVIVDHGMGIFSLYSHLNQIDVKVGEMVEKDGTLGRTGATGMAGGDHLHFSMMVNGIFVNPIEWWDAHWLELNIESNL